jgi:hypothetical protein
MNLQEFNCRLKELKEHIVDGLKTFQDDADVTVSSLLLELGEDDKYTLFTDFDFPEEKAE